MPNFILPNKTGTIEYRDIDITFLSNPATEDVRVKTDADAIKQSVRNIISTSFGEKPFHPEFGCGLRGLLFEPLDDITRERMLSAIRTSLENWEPRVKLISISVNENPYDDNEINLTVIFQILNGKNEGTQKLTALLKRVR